MAAHVLSFSELAAALWEISDQSWGMYAFSRDPLGRLVGFTEKRQLIAQAIQCGYQTAEQCLEKVGLTDGCLSLPRKLILAHNLNVEVVGQGQPPSIDTRICFATFSLPNTIAIMRPPLDKAYHTHQQDQPAQMETYFPKCMAIALLLGHEFFHYLESQDPTIPSQNKQRIRSRLPGFHRRVPIHAVSEIAAMYFAKRITAFTHSPFMLDLLLYYHYNAAAAFSMYEELISCEHSPCSMGR